MSLRAVALATLASLTAAAPARADTVAARCEVAPREKTLPRTTMGCTFSQRQGFIGLELADGRRLELAPEGGRRYRDADGQQVSASVSPAGQVFRLPRETVRVDWDTAGWPAFQPGVATVDQPFDRRWTLGRLSLRVTSANDGPRNRVTITPAGLSADNRPLVHDLDGRVAGVELADLDANGWPEVYVTLIDRDARRTGRLLAAAVNRGRSLTEIALPALGAGEALGWRGGDEFAVVENRLARRFRVYRDGDADGAPSGGWRQLQYRLVRGEATWRLQVDRVVDF